MLETESTNVKALYRRAQSYINMVDFDLAEFDIKKALEIDPANRYSCFCFTWCPKLLHFLHGVEGCTFL